jgi:hypothetical protein
MQWRARAVRYRTAVREGLLDVEYMRLRAGDDA